MRWIINFFRSKNLGRNDGALSPSDMQEWNRFAVDSKISKITQLYALSKQYFEQSTDCNNAAKSTSLLTESMILKKQADDLVNLTHRAYWGNKESMQRYDSEILEHYSSFSHDPRVSMTFIVFLLAATMKLFKITHNDTTCCSSLALVTAFAPLIAGLTLIQFIHHQNYQNEAIQLNRHQKFFFFQSQQNSTILVKTNNTELLNTPPEINETHLLPR